MQVVSQAVVGNFEVAVYQDGDLRIETLKSRNAPEGSEFLPAKILDKGGKILWKFDKQRYLGAYAWLREVDGFGGIIAYATRHELIETISVAHLPKMCTVHDAAGRENYEGGLSILQVVELKQLLAKDLGVEPKFTPNEGLIVKRLREQKEAEGKAKRLAEAAARQQARESQAREHSAKMAAILARNPIAGFTIEGQRLTGIPVIEKEYEMLPHGKFVVVVTSYDSTTGSHGDLVEHFSMKKTTGGRVEKINPRPVTVANPVERQATAKMEAKLLFEVGNDYIQAGLYRRKDIDALHAAGLNSATKVGLYPANPDGTVTLYEVTKKGVREIGRFSPIVA